MRQRTRASRGFTLLELQIAVLLLAGGVVTLSSLIMTQSRLNAKLRGNFKNNSMLYLTRPADPWITKMKIPAQVSSVPITPTTAPTISHPVNDVTIVETQLGLMDESIVVTADVTPAGGGS
jgi:hypothetical protein